MGLRQSKNAVLTFEEAKARVGPEAEQRLRDAFKRYANSYQLLHRVFFIREVLGDIIPERIAEEIYKAFGGGTNGLSFKDLIIGLALLTSTNKEEKAKFLFSLFSNDSDFVEKRCMDQLLIEIEGKPSHAVNFLFRIRDRVTFDEFYSWIINYPDATACSNWLMKEKLELTDHVETKTFYSTLVGVTHLDENEITQLEHRFWQLKPPSGRIDTNVFIDRIGDLLPVPVIERLFRAFDVNGDAQIDFKEMTCGVSACCRGPDGEQEKFCFKIFDNDADGYLDRESFTKMLEEFKRAWTVNDVCSDSFGTIEKNVTIPALLDSALKGEQSKMTLDEYLVWISEAQKGLSTAFLDLLSQICHVIFGLPPKNKEEERRVVLHWFNREKKGGLLKMDRRFFLLSKEWWDRWNAYVASKPGLVPQLSAESGLSDATVRHNSGDPVVSLGVPAAPKKSRSADNLVGMATNQSGVATDEQMSANSRSNSSISADQRSLNRVDSMPVKEMRNAAKDRRRVIQAIGGPREPGPIDNGSLVANIKNSQTANRLQTITDEGDIVRRNVIDEQDYVILPEKLWDCLFRRYNGGPTLPRMAVKNVAGRLELELHPIMVRILRHQTTPERGVGGSGSGAKAETTPVRYIPQAGSFWGASNQSSAPVNPNGLVNPPRRKPIHIAFFSKVHTVSQIYTFLGNKLRIAREEMRLWLYVHEAQMILLEDEEQEFGQAAEQVHLVSGLRDVVYDGRAAPLNLLLEVRNKDLTWPEEIYQLAKTGLLRSRRTSLVLGVAGLNNLGNTCFLNAAVQCVSNTSALRHYFTKELYAYELNKNNPLGMKGHIARRYGELLVDLWSGGTCVVAPLKLRMTIAKYSTQFSGNMQHDAHEFLAFLLDGLHEDLNRVMVKPYVELKDSDGRDDAIVAEEAWDNHLRRNQSIVVDLFHGLLKSQVRCGTCEHVSVRFDPFSVLSLPLPMESSQPIDVIVSRLDESQPVRYRLLLNHDDRFRAVKNELASFYDGVSPDSILLAEVLNSQIRCFPSDGEKVNRLTISSVYAYIFPCPPASATPAEQLSRGNGVTSGSSQGSQDDASSSASTPSPGIARNSSCSSLTAVGDGVCAFDCFVAYHRKMERNDVYFLAHMKARPRLFGLPIVIPSACSSRKELYESVWTQVKRLMGPKTNESTFFSNHATDCDDNSNNQFPFQLKVVDRMGMRCPHCDWYKLCRGCLVPCDNAPVENTFGNGRRQMPNGAHYLAIDWEPTALHLRYQSSREYDFEVHRSVQEAERRLTEPMDLKTCLDHFVQQEELGEEDCYYCSKCQKHRRAQKKLDIWKAPPILIIHLKRFHFVNNRWMKSHKIVNFPRQDLDLSEYIVSRGKVDDRLHNSCVDSETPTLNGNGSANYDKCSFVEEAEEADTNGNGEEALPPSFIVNDGGGEHRYKLYAIICHLGALGGGHYVSYARNPNKKWYRFNDSSTKEVSENEIDVNSAYILFYEREHTNWLTLMPTVVGRTKVPVDDDDDIDSDIKKVCSIQ